MIEQLFLLIVGAVVGSVAGALIGSSARGRPTAGFWLGLLLGPVGWLLVFALADLRPKCLRCKGALGRGALRCMHCGYDLVQVDKLRSSACSFCGSLVRRGASVCASCGNEVKTERRSA